MEFINRISLNEEINNIKINEPINLFKNIKSLYIIKKIFSHIFEINKLDIIKYNKKYQNIFGINIDYYKIISGKYRII